MSANLSVPDPPSTGDDRACVNCGRVVNPDRERLCNHCGLPFRTVSAEGPPIEEPGSVGRMLLKLVATLAVALPPLGPLSSLSRDPGTMLGFGMVVIASAAAVVLAWWRPLPGGILVALVGSVCFIVELIVDATGAADPSSRYWLFWFFPGGLVGGALFLAAAFWRAPGPSEGAERAAAEPPGRVSLVERLRREAIGLAVLVVVGLVFVAVVASYPEGLDPTSNQAIPAAILVVGFPLLLAGAGVLGYREDRARGSFVAGLVAAVVAMVGILIAATITGQQVLQVGEGEWIGEAFLAAGLAIVGGGLFGILGGGITALVHHR
jgi:hypothetical protein